MQNSTNNNEITYNFTVLERFTGEKEYKVIRFTREKDMAEQVKSSRTKNCVNRDVIIKDYEGETLNSYIDIEASKESSKTNYKDLTPKTKVRCIDFNDDAFGKYGEVIENNSNGILVAFKEYRKGVTVKHTSHTGYKSNEKKHEWYDPCLVGGQLEVVVPVAPAPKKLLPEQVSIQQVTMRQGIRYELSFYDVTDKQFKCLELEDSNGKRFELADQPELEALKDRAIALLETNDFYSFRGFYSAFHRPEPAPFSELVDSLQEKLNGLKRSVKALESDIGRIKSSYYSDEING